MVHAEPPRVSRLLLVLEIADEDAGMGIVAGRADHDLHGAAVAGDGDHQAGGRLVIAVVAHVHGVALVGQGIGDDLHQIGGIRIKAVPGQRGQRQGQRGTQGDDGRQTPDTLIA